jgi:hypothetical protein
MYVLHKDDGSITGVVMGDKNYGADLTRVGHQWIYLAAQDDSRVFNFDTMAHYVDIENKTAGVPHPDCLLPKQSIELICEKTIIEANGDDTALVSGIPSGSRVVIQADSYKQFDGQVDDGTVELSATDPATYTVTVIPAAQYLPATIQVTAK